MARPMAGDLVWEQYGPVTSGAMPPGLLQNIKPYREKPNPYVKGNTSWLSLFSPSTVPYMTSPNGDIDIILGSNVETGMFYSKEAFTKAGITAAPTTWAEFMTDLGKLKSAGVTPIIFADGGPCNPSWFERLATSSMLAGQVSQFNVNHAQVTTALEVAVGIHKNIISMSNPRYAAVWKLLGQLIGYSAKGTSSYDACSAPTATTPPLSTESLLIQGKRHRERPHPQRRPGRGPRPGRCRARLRGRLPWRPWCHRGGLRGRVGLARVHRTRPVRGVFLTSEHRLWSLRNG